MNRSEKRNTIMKRSHSARGRGAALAVLGAILLFTGCDAVDNLMKVENPARIQEEDFSNPALAQLLVNSAIGRFNSAYDVPFIWRGSALTDEMITGVNYEDQKRVNNRVVYYHETPTDAMFSELHAARAIAETAVKYLREALENPESDARLATALAYAGYTYILVGDALCETTLDGESRIYTPVEIYGIAIERLEEALTIAQAAGNSRVANLARVGLARAHLNRGEFSQVMQYARDVPSDFVWWAEYHETDTRADNELYGWITGANHTIGVHPRFLNGTWLERTPDANQSDPRIQHAPMWETGHDGETPLYKPYQSLPYSGYTGKTIAEGAVPGVDVTIYSMGSDIKVASYVEAMHSYYEAAGPDGTGPEGTTLEWVNKRRAFGNQPPVNLSGDELMSELREQRARDLFLGGFRLGDLRRYLRLGINDPRHQFPSGPHPVAQRGNYGTDTCFPIPLTEYQGNKNLDNPHLQQ